MLLTGDQILAADDRKPERVRVPEWRDKKTGADEVLVRGLDGIGRDEYLATLSHQVGNRQVLNTTGGTVRLVARCLITEAGDLLLTEEQVRGLGRKSGAALARVFEVAARLSGIGEEVTAELGEGSTSTPNGSPTSASPAISGALSPGSSP